MYAFRSSFSLAQMRILLTLQVDPTIHVLVSSCLKIYFYALVLVGDKKQMAIQIVFGIGRNKFPSKRILYKALYVCFYFSGCIQRAHTILREYPVKTFALK